MNPRMQVRMRQFYAVMVFLGVTTLLLCGCSRQHVMPAGQLPLLCHAGGE